MILECSHCGAPLDAKSQGGIIKCNYCDRQHRAQALPVQQPFTPHAWQPPPTWTPPPQYAVQVQQPFVYHQQRSASGCGLAFAVLMILGVAGAGVAVAVGGLGSNPFASWDGKSTLECDGTQKKKVANVTMTESLDKVIRTSGICKLEIRDSDLIGDKVLTAEGSSEIVMIGGSIEMGKEGLEALHAARIELRGVTITLADGRKSLDGVTVMRAENLGKLELRDTDVEMPTKLGGKALLVDLRHAAKATIDGGEFKGAFKVAIDFSSELRASDTTIKAIVEGDGKTVEGITALATTAPTASAEPVPAPPPETAPAPAKPPPQQQQQQQQQQQPKPTATSVTKQRTSRCGCKANDLVCAQKCNARK